ncbi:hypothetical protein FOZ62_013874, partial [Perkinsus olseni]
AFAGLLAWYSMPHPESSANLGAAIALAVGLNGRILIFLDGSFAAIECPSGVPQGDSVPVYPIIEESGEATQVTLTPGDKVPKGGEGSISADEPLSGSDDSDHGSHTSSTT